MDSIETTEKGTAKKSDPAYENIESKPPLTTVLFSHALPVPPTKDVTQSIKSIVFSYIKGADIWVDKAKHHTQNSLSQSCFQPFTPNTI